MKTENLQSITELIFKMRPTLYSQFVKPIKEMHRGVFPQGYIQVMFMLAKQKEPVSMTDLALATCISKPNLTTVIDRLCTDNFAERCSDENDRRVINVSLTAKGYKFLKNHGNNVRQLIEEKVSVLEDTDIQKLHGALIDITDILEKIKGYQKNNKND